MSFFKRTTNITDKVIDEIKVAIDYGLSQSAVSSLISKGELDFAAAFKRPRKQLKASVPVNEWQKYAHLWEWDDSNSIKFLNADLISNKSPLSCDLNIDVQSGRIDLSILDNPSSWVSNKIYQNTLDLLEDLKRTTSTDLSNSKIRTLFNNELSTLISNVMKSVDSDKFNSVFKDSLEKFYKIWNTFSLQIKHVNCFVKNGATYGSYKFLTGTPLEESTRLFVYIINNLLFNKYPEICEELMNSTIQSLSYTHIDFSYLDSGSVPVFVDDTSKSTEFWSLLQEFMTNKNFIIDNEVKGLAWASLLLLEHTINYNDSFSLEWHPDVLLQIISDKKYRDTLLGGLPRDYLDEPSSLLDCYQYFTVNFSKYTESRAANLITDTTRLFRSVFNKINAQNRGLNINHPVELFKYKDIDLIKSQGYDENFKKKLALFLDALAANGPERYLADIPAISKLDELEAKYPNFKAVIHFVRKQFDLINLQKDKVISLPPILLVGDPGLGKTKFISSLAAIMNVDTKEIPMSSISAGWVLSGSDVSWEGGKPGRVAESLMYSPCANSIVILDELDKSSKDGKCDPHGPLFQLLERHTAEKFVDEALRVPLNTKHLIWFATANDASLLSEAIRSRFEIFEIPALDKDSTVIVAQSIYSDLINDHQWGSAFTDHLDSEVAVKLYGFNARDIYKSINRACANAAIKDIRPIVLEISDFDCLPKTRRARNA